MENPTRLMKLSVIIVNYETRADLIKCLDSLKKYAPVAAHEVFVVDNASTDGSADMIAREYPHVTLIRNPSNEGFSRANNRAIQKAQGEYIFLLNPDAQVTEGVFDRLISLADKIPNLGTLAPILFYPDGTYQPSSYRFPGAVSELRKLLFLEKSHENRARTQKITRTDWSCGAALLFKRLQDKHLVLLDPSIFMYSEDIELCWRMSRHGLINYVTSTARVIHAHNKSGQVAYGPRSSVKRLSAMYTTLRYVMSKYRAGPLFKLRFRLFGWLVALNAHFRAALLRLGARKSLSQDERRGRIQEHLATASVFSGKTSSEYPLVSKAEKSVLVLAFVLFTAIMTIIAVQLPRGRGNDEDSHTTYVRYVADTGTLPDPLNLDFGVNREPHQPPLFYLLGAVWLKVVRPLGLGIDSLRLMMIVLGMAQFWLIWKIARTTLPSGWRVVPLALFAALPMAAHLFATTNNDALAIVFSTLLWYITLRIWRSPRARHWYYLAALTGALAVLSKLFAVPVVLVAGLAISITAWRNGLLSTWVRALTVGSIPLIAWLIFNQITSGYLIPEIHLADLPILAPYIDPPDRTAPRAFLIVLFETLVGRYGSWDIAFPEWYYLCYYAVTLLALFGLTLKSKVSHALGRVLPWALFGLLANLTALIYLNLEFFQPQARYLYPSIIAILLALTLGLYKLSTRFSVNKKTSAWTLVALVFLALSIITLALTPIVLV
jgi:N-acetylglucosaminyl-diphospho-decaprenol L-rhamnosyltransferase